MISDPLQFVESFRFRIVHAEAPLMFREHRLDAQDTNERASAGGFSRFLKKSLKAR
jgi:hypothetical protein